MLAAAGEVAAKGEYGEGEDGGGRDGTYFFVV